MNKALEVRDINRNLPEINAVKALLRKAFSKEEQIPFFILRFRNLSRRVSFEAYYDEEGFCGFSYCIETDNIAFILLLAVIEEARGKGIGSKTLSYLKDKYKNKPLTVNIEPLDQNAENSLQRERRLAFYKRNGFVETGYMVRGEKVSYMILSTEEGFDVREYKKLIKKFSLNTYRPRVEK